MVQSFVYKQASLISSPQKLSPQCNTTPGKHNKLLQPHKFHTNYELNSQVILSYKLHAQEVFGDLCVFRGRRGGRGGGRRAEDVQMIRRRRTLGGHAIEACRLGGVGPASVQTTRTPCGCQDRPIINAQRMKMKTVINV